MSHSIPSEAFKELLFGGAFGLCSGFAVKKLSLPFIAGTVYRLDTEAESFYYVNYGSSIIVSKVSQIPYSREY